MFPAVSNPKLYRASIFIDQMAGIDGTTIA